MICCKVLLQLFIVEVILRVSSAISSVANVTSLVLLSTVIVKFIITVEPLLTETTFWMSLEARLINCAGIVITVLFVFSQFAKSEQFVFVGEDLFVSGA